MSDFDISASRKLAADAAARAEKATPGNWEVRHDNAGNGREFWRVNSPDANICTLDAFQWAAQGRQEERASNAAFIAAARQDVPALSAALAAACDEVEEWRNYRQWCLNPAPDEQHCACVPGLHMEVARLTAERDALKAALETIFDPANWADDDMDNNVWVNDNVDPFDVAREALASLRQARGEEREE